MDGKVNADLKTLKIIFNNYKPYILSVVIMLVSIILFFKLVIPQFGALLEEKKVAKEALSKVEALKANMSVLTNIDENSLDSQLKILSLALPLNKDLIGILNSVYFAVQKTGVSLGSFSIKVGDLSESGTGDNSPVIKISAPINSSVAGINDFVQTISKMAPLVDVYSVKISKTSSMVSLSFYYKPFSVSNLSQDVPISPVSQKTLTLVSQLKGFENASAATLSIPSIPAASTSASASK